MKRNRKKAEEIRVYMTETQKNQLRRLAESAGKTMSEFLLDAALFSTTNEISDAKNKFYQNIQSEFLHLKKFQYIAIRLLLFIGSTLLKSDAEIMKYFHESEAKADEKFGKLEG